ncbi:MAG: hypothetical protein AAF572_24205 [Cyanobacteria bacterium P01_B01_bin.77]
MEALEAGGGAIEASLSVVEANPQNTFPIIVSLPVDTLRLALSFQPRAGDRFIARCKI